MIWISCQDKTDFGKWYTFYTKKRVFSLQKNFQKYLWAYNSGTANHSTSNLTAFDSLDFFGRDSWFSDRKKYKFRFEEVINRTMSFSDMLCFGKKKSKKIQNAWCGILGSRFLFRWLQLVKSANFKRFRGGINKLGWYDQIREKILMSYITKNLAK